MQKFTAINLRFLRNKLTVLLFSLMLTSVYAENRKSLAILSCGGGGTHYTAACLQICGMDIGHEYIGEDGYVGWPLVEGFYNFRGEPINEAEFEHIFHQVRNPLSVIKTWMKTTDLKNHTWKFIRRSIPEIKEDDSLIEQCAKYWYYWNKKAEKKAEWSFQVEHFLDVFEEFEIRLGIVLDIQKAKTIPINTYSWPGFSEEITWDFLEKNLPDYLYRNIQEMAHSYGYLPNT